MLNAKLSNNFKITVDNAFNGLIQGFNIFWISQLGKKLAIAKFMCSIICIFLSLVNEATKNI